MTNIIKWGILGCGLIAHTFATGLKALPDARLEAVASRTEGKAEKFSNSFKVQNKYNNYEDLVNDPNVDVIYIATTHNFHHENTLLCLNHGKAVLCEKSFALNAIQAEEMINMARKKKIFLMEAMWTRFLPCVIKLREILEGGELGDIQHIKADYGRATKVKSDHRLINPNLGGGALLDLGIYSISFAQMIFKQSPLKIMSTASFGETGVDETSYYFFEYENRRTAMLSASFKFTMPHTTYIFGTKGYIEVQDFSHPTKMILKLEKKPKKTLEIPYDSVGYNYEAKEVMNCLNAGKLESDIMPLDQTLEIMKIMDTLREQWAFKYPGEREQ